MNAFTKSTIGRARTALQAGRRARNAFCASFAALSLSSPAAVLAGHELPRSVFAADMPASNDEAFATGASFAPEDCPTARTVQRGGISLSQATAIAQSRVPGRVVSAKSVMSGDRVIHEIRILGDDGRVRTVRVDAQSGAVM